MTFAKLESSAGLGAPSIFYVLGGLEGMSSFTYHTGESPPARVWPPTRAP